MANPAAFHDPAYRVANLLTVLLDAVAVAAALALTHRWGRRLPAWLVLLPAWVASGLLGTLLVLAPLAAPLVSSTPAGNGTDALRGWVYLLVYGGFTVQGVLLLTAFVLYARDRWRADLAEALAEPAEAWQARAATTLAPLSAAVGVPHLAWSLGLTVGLGGLAERHTDVDRATLGCTDCAFWLLARGRS